MPLSENDCMAYIAIQSGGSSVRPLLEGDEILGRMVRGFAWKAPAPGQPTGHHDDQLLLDGDDRSSAPPDRPVPQTADGARTTASIPPADLPAGRVTPAADIDAGLVIRVNDLLNLPGRGWQPVIRPLLAAVHAGGHRLWLAGGAVRDSVAGVPAEKVNDLDMTGTAPPGRFVDMAYQALRAAGKSEYRLSISPKSLVCAVAVTRQERIIEYRGLSAGGFAFPAVGSRLAEDARHRDFSFNALVYDALDHELFDPTGCGLSDLTGIPRRFRPIRNTDRPLDTAEIVLRAMKFALRWKTTVDVDLELFRRWVAELPADLPDRLTPDDWAVLRGLIRKLEEPEDRKRAFASCLPPVGRGLILTLLGGAR
jgi:poly(A) polymerase